MDSILKDRSQKKNLQKVESMGTPTGLCRRNTRLCVRGTRYNLLGLMLLVLFSIDFLKLVYKVVHNFFSKWENEMDVLMSTNLFGPSILK